MQKTQNQTEPHEVENVDSIDVLQPQRATLTTLTTLTVWSPSLLMIKLTPNSMHVDACDIHIAMLFLVPPKWLKRGVLAILAVPKMAGTKIGPRKVIFGHLINFAYFYVIFPLARALFFKPVSSHENVDRFFSNFLCHFCT